VPPHVVLAQAAVVADVALVDLEQRQAVVPEAAVGTTAGVFPPAVPQSSDELRAGPHECGDGEMVVRAVLSPKVLVDQRPTAVDRMVL